MSINNYENSVSRGVPVGLYLFRHGASPDQFRAYTDGDTAVEYDGITYQPAVISGSNIKISTSPKEGEFQITCSAAFEMAQMMLYYPTSYIISLIVRQGHLPEPDAPAGWDTGITFPVVFCGTVIERNGGDGSTAVLTCVTVGYGLKRAGLTRHWQYGCPLQLYGPDCKASAALASTPAVISAVGTSTLTLESGWRKPDTIGEDYVGGSILWEADYGTEYRMIMRVVGNTIHLAGPVDSLEILGEITVRLGCPRTTESCRSLHNNIVNYGGHPFIPSLNPVGKNVYD